MIISATFLIANLIVDVLVTILNPRLRYSEASK
jgi:ABC-type dipeptide/oligopeptide/nickel transport system permease component